MTIPDDAVLSVRWLRVDDIVTWDQALTAEQVSFYERSMRGGGHVAPPVVEPDGRGLWRVRDGRHRVSAHRRLGRELVRCVVVEQRGAGQ